MKKLSSTLLAVMTLAAPTAYAGFSCQLYSGDLPNRDIVDDGALNGWLKQMDAANPSGNFKLVGNFSKDSGNLVFKYSDSQHTYPFAAGTPDSTIGSGYGDCNVAKKKVSGGGIGDALSNSLSDKVVFSCYDGGSWNGRDWSALFSSDRDAKFSSVVPHDMPNSVGGTQVYVLQANPNFPDGARNTLFFVGSDCKKLMNNFAQGGKPDTLRDFYQNLMKVQNPPGSLLTNSDDPAVFMYPTADAPNGPQSAPAPAAPAESGQAN